MVVAAVAELHDVPVAQRANALQLAPQGEAGMVVGVAGDRHLFERDEIARRQTAGQLDDPWDPRPSSRTRR